MAVEAVAGLVGTDRGDQRVGAGEQRAGPGVDPKCSLHQTRRLSGPYTRAFHSPLSQTLSPVASTARCKGPPEGRAGFGTVSVAAQREKVKQCGTAIFSPGSSARPCRKP